MVFWYEQIECWATWTLRAGFGIVEFGNVSFRCQGGGGQSLFNLWLKVVGSASWA